MKGLNSKLTSKEDYLWAKNNLPEEQWKPLFQNLLDTIYDWFMIKEEEYKEDDKNYKKVEGRDGNIYYYQKQKNPNAKIFRLGFTEKEVQDELL